MSSGYNAISPYGNNGYSESTAYVNQPQPPPLGTTPPKKGISNWIKFGVPVAIVVIAGGVVGGILASRAKNGGGGSSGSAEAAQSAKAAIGLFPTATNSDWLVPLYPSTSAAAFSTPTFLATKDTGHSWPEDPFKPANPSPTNVRQDRPRLIAPAYKWQALPELIKNEPYMKDWNDKIIANATQYMALPPVAYFLDGDSGILDNAREIKMRIKAFAYAYRVTKETKWVDRCWEEIKNAAGDGVNQFGPAEDKWNSGHFLDVAELTAAFGIAYDWLHDIWTAEQKASIMATMIRYGLNFGVRAYDDALDGNINGWWRKGVHGNWNCVCNGGLTLGALAILGDDTSGIATRLLGLTVDNAKENCAFGPSSDGTWNETANYWYFGTTSHAEMTSSLLSATGSDYGILDANPAGKFSGLYHMYAFGPATLFDWGDHGPPKFSATANSMIFYADAYKMAQYALFQRDRFDAAEPWSVFWYNPSVSGAYWNGLALDHYFDDPGDQWASMRSSWTDINALYVGVKAGRNLGHQTHQDLDAGDFVLDALGTRWAGELGSGDYRSVRYFSTEAADSTRWLYYRKRTEGQNTLVVDRANQRVDCNPTVKYGSSETKQGASTIFSVPQDSNVFWTADLTSAYDKASSVKRGVRLLNGRKQVLIQDEITATADVEWRMHTNATVTTNGASATLKIGDKTMEMTILNPPSGARIETTTPTRYSSDPPTPPESPDQDNPGVTVVVIRLPAGAHNLQVLFNPQWEGMSPSDFKTPAMVPIDNWSLTSHN